MNRDAKIINLAFLAFVRTKPCCACLKPGPSDADHLQAVGRGSAKRNDLTAIPACRKCHSQRHQIGNKSMEVIYQFNLWEENSRLLIEFFGGKDE